MQAVPTIVNPVKMDMSVINVLMAITMIARSRVDVSNVHRDVSFVLGLIHVTHVSKECIKKS